MEKLTEAKKVINYESPTIVLRLTFKEQAKIKAYNSLCLLRRNQINKWESHQVKDITFLIRQRRKLPKEMANATR